MKLIKIAVLVFLVSACSSTEKPKKETLDKVDYEYAIDSIDQVQARHKLSTELEDSIEVFLNDMHVGSIPYTYIDSNYFSNSGIYLFGEDSAVDQKDILFMDSTVLIPVNDMNGRIILLGYNVLTGKNLDVGDKEFYLSSNREFFVHYDKKEIAVVNSNYIDEIKVSSYVLGRDKFIYKRSKTFVKEELTDSIILNWMNS